MSKTTTRRHIMRAATAAPLAAPLILADAHASAPKGGQQGTTDFFGQMQVTANVVRNGRSVQTFQIDAGLFQTDQAKRDRALALAPPLRAAWRAVAQDYANRYYTPGDVPDSALMANLLQGATDRTLGAGQARVLMVAVVVR